MEQNSSRRPAQPQPQRCPRAGTRLWGHGDNGDGGGGATPCCRLPPPVLAGREVRTVPELSLVGFHVLGVWCGFAWWKNFVTLSPGSGCGAWGLLQPCTPSCFQPPFCKRWQTWLCLDPLGSNLTHPCASASTLSCHSPGYLWALPTICSVAAGAPSLPPCTHRHSFACSPRVFISETCLAKG